MAKALPLLVRFKVAWQQYRVGDFIRPRPLLRAWLVRSGYCDIVAEPAPAEAPAPVPSPTPAADLAMTPSETEENHDSQPGPKGRPHHPARGKRQ